MARLSYESLQKQITKLQAQAAKMEASQSAAKKKSVAKVVALMKKLGITASDLVSKEKSMPVSRRSRKSSSVRKGRGSDKRSSVTIKYRHPVSGETWTGRGKPPKWLVAEIASGRSKDDFLIPSTTDLHDLSSSIPTSSELIV